MPDPIPPSDCEVSNERLSAPQLVENRYLGLLTTYHVPWDNEKTARDVWQNFFDGQGGTLDGVIFSKKKTPTGTEVSITGLGEYSYMHLMHMGGGTKTLEDSNVGGYREGAKVAALIMLTRMGAQQVVHESDDWRLTYYLAEVPDYKNGEEPAQGLYAKVERVPHQAGSRFRVNFPDVKTAKQFIDARNLFYSSENPDFQNPTYENPDVGGFKLHKGKKGNIYEAGQRRLFIKSAGLGLRTTEGTYDAVPDITLWTNGKVFSADRDRGAISEQQVTQRMIDSIVQGMSEDDIRTVILNNPQFWYGKEKPVVEADPNSIDLDTIDEPPDYDPNASKSETRAFLARWTEELMDALYPTTVAGQLLDRIIDSYTEKYKGAPMKFPDKYIAQGSGQYDSALEQAGYIICHPAMQELGMATTDETFMKMMEHFRVEPTEAENIRTALLQKFARDVLRIPDAPPIWMFNAAREKSFLHGHYTPQFLWVSQEQVHREFSTALRTYLHEITHKFISGHNQDFVREFSRVYNEAMLEMEKAIVDPTSDEGKRMKDILDRWETTKGNLDKPPEASPYEY
jgi:hypothetical protein